MGDPIPRHGDVLSRYRSRSDRLVWTVGLLHEQLLCGDELVHLLAVERVNPSFALDEFPERTLKSHIAGRNTQALTPKTGSS
jgi:hypothetical protein